MPHFRHLVRAIVTLLAASFGLSNAYANERYEYPKQYTVSPKGVNVQTGRLFYTRTDLSIGPLNFVRTWGDLPRFPSVSIGVPGIAANMHVGWTHIFNEGVTAEAPQNEKLYTVAVGGQRYRYRRLADANIVPGDISSQGTFFEMVAGKWRLTDRAGNVFVFFAHSALSQPFAPEQSIQVLESVTFANGSRNSYSYNAQAQVRYVENSLGYALTLEYGAWGVQTVCGRNRGVQYVDSSTGCAGATLKVTYGYDASGRLSQVTDVSNDVRTFRYAGTTLFPTCLSLANSAVCEIENSYGTQPGDPTPSVYGDPDQVRRQTTATGSVWRYNYRKAENPLDVPPGDGEPVYSLVFMYDPLDVVTRLKYDRGHLVETIGPDGTTNYKYKAAYLPGRISKDVHYELPSFVTYPNGLREYLEYDGRGNVVVQSTWPTTAGPPLTVEGQPALSSNEKVALCCIALEPLQIPAGSSTYRQTFLADWYAVSAYGQQFTFGCGIGPADAKRCDKPLTRIDANNNQTDYTYDPAHGGALTETGPGVMSPGVGSVRPRTRFAYIQRQAWVKTPGGGFAQTGLPVWLLASKSICKTGAASGAGCATASDEVRTLYDYGPDAGPNNLLLRGTIDDATGAALRTCYGYDAQGNKISETKPRAGLASCP